MDFACNKSSEEKQDNEGAGIEKLKVLRDKNILKCSTCNGHHCASKCSCKDTVLDFFRIGQGGDSHKPVGIYVPPSLRKRSDKSRSVQSTNLSESTTKTDSEDQLARLCGPLMKFSIDAVKTVETCNDHTSKEVPLIVHWAKAPRKAGEAFIRYDNQNMPTSGLESKIRISKLNWSTTKTDVEELVRPFGPFQFVDLPKDRYNEHCRGVAFVQFEFSNDAAKAIETLNGHLVVHLPRPPRNTQ